MSIIFGGDMRGKVSWFLVVALLCSGMVFAAPPTDENIKKAKTGGYIVKKGKDTGKDSGNGDIGIQRVYDTITQEEANWYTREVTGGNLMTVDLNWGDTSDSLRLTIYTADGYKLGPYYDNSDGAIDGRIYLDIYNPNGLGVGTWYFEVYGYSVQGTEDYYIQ